MTEEILILRKDFSQVFKLILKTEKDSADMENIIVSIFAYLYWLCSPCFVYFSNSEIPMMSTHISLKKATLRTP